MASRLRLNDRDARNLGIGSHVFLPGHGVAEVRAIEEHAFGDTPQRFYVMAFTHGGKLMLPVDNVDKAGVRDLVTADKAREMLDTVRSPPEAEANTYWKTRALTYADGLKSGDADRYTEILQQLLARARSSTLSASDSRMLQTARAYFLAEISTVLEEPTHVIEAVLHGHEAKGSAAPA